MQGLNALFLSGLFCTTMCRWVGQNREAPFVDDNQDVMMTMAEEVNGRTTISFTRARVTHDSSPIDVALDHPVFFLWATGPVTDFSRQSIGIHIRRGISSQMIELPSAAKCPSRGKIKSHLSWERSCAIMIHML